MNLISYRRILITYLFIIFIIFLNENISFWFYPVSIFILGHLYLTLVLLGHEGAHGLLHKNPKINTLITSLFCHFPVFVSHAQYRFLHLHHHRFQNTKNDFDYPFYDKTYPSFKSFLWDSLIQTITFRYFVNFLTYFNGLNLWLMKRQQPNYKKDYPYFIIFWISILYICFQYNLWRQLVLYWFIPNWIFLFWIYLLNLYQHVTLKTHNVIINNKWISEFLFPLNINYHYTHHKHPNIPYYQLDTHPASNS